MSTDAPQYERVDDGSLSGILANMQNEYASQQQQATEPAPVEQAALPVETPQATEQPTEQPPETTQQATEQPPEQVAAVVPPPEPEIAAIPTPESRIAPLFELTGMPLDQALPQALNVITELHQHDPIAYGLLANAVIHASPNITRDIVLQREGIAPDKITQFNEWIAKGGDQLPLPIEYPVFNSLVQELSSDDVDAQWVKLPNGLEVDLKTPDGLDRYENAKFRYEMDVEKKTGEREKLVATQRQEEERQEQKAIQAQEVWNERAGFYSDYIRGTVNDVADKIIAQLGTDDSFRGEMLKSHIQNLFARPEVIEYTKKVNPYLEQGHGFVKNPATGQWQMTGRVKELADAQSAFVRREANKIKDQFNKDILRVNKAELAATAAEPKVAQFAQPIQSAAPQPPSTENAESVEDILAAAMAYDRHLAATRRQ